MSFLLLEFVSMTLITVKSVYNILLVFGYYN